MSVAHRKATPRRRTPKPAPRAGKSKSSAALRETSQPCRCETALAPRAQVVVILEKAAKLESRDHGADGQQPDETKGGVYHPFLLGQTGPCLSRGLQ